MNKVLQLHKKINIALDHGNFKEAYVLLTLLIYELKLLNMDYREQVKQLQDIAEALGVKRLGAVDEQR